MAKAIARGAQEAGIIEPAVRKADGTAKLSPKPSTNPTNLGNTPDVTPSSSSISPTPSIPEYSPPIIAIVVVVGSLLTMLLEKRRKQQTFST